MVVAWVTRENLICMLGSVVVSAPRGHWVGSGVECSRVVHSRGAWVWGCCPGCRWGAIDFPFRTAVKSSVARPRPHRAFLFSDCISPSAAAVGYATVFPFSISSTYLSCNGYSHPSHLPILVTLSSPASPLALYLIILSP